MNKTEILQELELLGDPCGYDFDCNQFVISRVKY